MKLIKKAISSYMELAEDTTDYPSMLGLFIILNFAILILLLLLSMIIYNMPVFSLITALCLIAIYKNRKTIKHVLSLFKARCGGVWKCVKQWADDHE